MEHHRKKPSLNAVVRELYASLGERMQLDEPLHRLGAIFGSHISGLHVEDFGAHRGRLTLAGDVGSHEFLELSQAYSNRWNGQNLWMERSLDGFRSQGWQHGDAVVGSGELRASAYYRHFLKPLDIRHGLGICIWNGGPLKMAVASFHRGHRGRGFDADDLKAVDEVRPHLVNAYAIYRRLARLEGSLVSFRACFDRATLGILMLTADGQLLEANAAAHDGLAKAGIRITREHKLALPPTLQRRYVELLRVLAAPHTASAQSLVVECACQEDAAPHRVVLHLCALPTDALHGASAGTRVLAFLAELQPGQSQALDESVLRQTLGLTPMEARVALALRRHIDVAATARALNLSPNTVRTHLRSLHGHLGMRRTSEIVQLVDRLIGSLPRNL